MNDNTEEEEIITCSFLSIAAATAVNGTDNTITILCT